MTKSLNTRLVHAGEHAPSAQGYTPTSLPVHASSTFFYPTLDALEAAFEKGGENVTYARHGNPSTNAFETLMAVINTPCALWQVAPMVLPSGRTASIEYTTFPIFNDREKKHQLVALARHEFPESVQCDEGKPAIQKASTLQWIDLGKGTPTFSKSRSAA